MFLQKMVSWNTSGGVNSVIWCAGSYIRAFLTPKAPNSSRFVHKSDAKPPHSDSQGSLYFHYVPLLKDFRIQWNYIFSFVFLLLQLIKFHITAIETSRFFLLFVVCVCMLLCIPLISLRTQFQFNTRRYYGFFSILSRTIYCMYVCPIVS